MTPPPPPPPHQFILDHTGPDEVVWFITNHFGPFPSTLQNFEIFGSHGTVSLSDHFERFKLLRHRRHHCWYYWHQHSIPIFFPYRCVVEGSTVRSSKLRPTIFHFSFRSFAVPPKYLSLMYHLVKIGCTLLDSLVCLRVVNLFL